MLQKIPTQDTLNSRALYSHYCQIDIIAQCTLKIEKCRATDEMRQERKEYKKIKIILSLGCFIPPTILH